MTATVPEELGQIPPAVADLEGQLKDVVRQNVSFLRKPSNASVDTADGVSTLIQRVAGVSLEEIDRVIGELEAMRERLLNEGNRVQREIAAYAALNETVLASTKAIEESLGQWRTSD